MTHNQPDDSPWPVTTDHSSCAHVASPRSEDLRQPAGTLDVLRGCISSGTLSGLATVILNHSSRATSRRLRALKRGSCLKDQVLARRLRAHAD